MTPLSSLHFQSLLYAFSLLSRTLISFLCMFSVASNPFSKWMLSQTIKSIPCGFKLFKLLHLLIVKSCSFCATFICRCYSCNSYSLLSLSEESSASSFEAFPNPFLMSSSSSSIPLSSPSLLDLSHCSSNLLFLLASRHSKSSWPSLLLSEGVRYPVLTVSQNLALEKGEMLVLYVTKGTCLPLNTASVVGVS